MIVVQSLMVALDMLRRNKLRAFLTMLGVIIGVMSVTLIVMISGGFQNYLNVQFRKLGADTMFVFFDPGRRERGQALGSIEGLTMDDMRYLLERATVLDIASPLTQVPAQPVRYGEREYKNPQIFASDENFSELNRMAIVQGRHLTKADLDSRANVAVIGEDVRDRIFGKTDPIGKRMTLKGISLEVVGVVEKMEFMGDNTGRLLLLPLTTAQDKWVGGKNLMMIMLRAKKGTPVDQAMQEVWEALMSRSNNKPIYRLDSRESILDVFKGVLGVAGMALAAVAALSLLVGGIGIMNIMLVSVTERTREIGLRKAVGAKNKFVLTQFLIEAATLSLIGGIIGMLFARGLGYAVTLVTAAREWPAKGGLELPFPILAALMAAAFSALIGMVFGFFPAASAAKLDPIVALRHE
ncbi:MAG: ABC transporter permease [Fimbriimonadaceae bacterium]|nr:ABC transporter permease [Fimbriimonadaceae bacterium]